MYEYNFWKQQFENKIQNCSIQSFNIMKSRQRGCYLLGQKYNACVFHHIARMNTTDIIYFYCHRFIYFVTICIEFYVVDFPVFKTI